MKGRLALRQREKCEKITDTLADMSSAYPWGPGEHADPQLSICLKSRRVAVQACNQPGMRGGPADACGVGV